MRRSRIALVQKRTLAILSASLSTLTACATIGTRPINTQEKLVHESIEEVLVDGPGKPTAVVDGTLLKLRAVGLCRNRSVRRFDEVETRERYMEDRAYPWYMAGIGLAAATAGVIGLADSTKVYDKNTSSRTYNPEGPGKAFLANGALLATGVAAGAVLLVDAIRASGTVQVVKPKDDPSEPAGDEFPCTNKVLENEPIVALAGGEQRTLGSTSGAGTLEVDLDDILPKTFVDDELKLAMRGSTVLTVDVTSLQRSREERLWAHLQLDQCRTPTTSDSCADLKGFLHLFPAGIHGKEAKAIVETAEPTLARLLDEEEWQRLDTVCKTANFTSSDAGAKACIPLRGYLERHPTGAHASEATKLLATADHKIAQLAAAEKAAERREEAEAEAAERTRQATLVNQCQAECRNECRGPIYDDKAMCTRGCYAVRCGQGDACSGRCSAGCSTNRYYGDHDGCLRDCRTSQECGK